jgi:outer membrane lipoprotein-sorting protein
MISRALFSGTLVSTFGAPAVLHAQSGKNAFTDTLVQPRFSKTDQDLIDKARAHLQTLSAAKGRFTQTDNRARQSKGVWYLSRPGKIRFEYDAPTSLLIISDGKTVKKWDPRLKTMDAFPLSETPLSLFLSRQIRFDQGVIITKITKDNSGFKLTARDRRKQVEGYIDLRFEGPSPKLKSWTITDAQGRATTILLDTIEPMGIAKADLFVMKIQ